MIVQTEFQFTKDVNMLNKRNKTYPQDSLELRSMRKKKCWKTYKKMHMVQLKISWTQPRHSHSHSTLLKLLCTFSTTGTIAGSSMSS